MSGKQSTEGKVGYEKGRVGLRGQGDLESTADGGGALGVWRRELCCCRSHWQRIYWPWNLQGYVGGRRGLFVFNGGIQNGSGFRYTYSLDEKVLIGHKEGS